MDQSGVLEGTLSYVQAEYIQYLNSLQDYWSLLIFIQSSNGSRVLTKPRSQQLFGFDMRNHYH